MKASVSASNDSNCGSGDDFDDFEEGAQADADDDFGDFDDGFEEPSFAQEARLTAQPTAQEAPIPSFVSSNGPIVLCNEIYFVLRYPLWYPCLYSFSLLLTMVQLYRCQTY
jgi:hypothetical protein